MADFTFAHREEGFDEHIDWSIRGYSNLLEDVITFSRYFVENDTMVEFNPKLLNSQNFKILVQLPKILQDSGKLGEFQLEIFNIFISSLKTYEKELISAV